jgi:hypothetical protein
VSISSRRWLPLRMNTKPNSGVPSGSQPSPLSRSPGPMHRKLNEEALRSLLCAIRDGIDLPPIAVFRDPGATTAAPLDGLCRGQVSLRSGLHPGLPSIVYCALRSAASSRY